jgi:hypothetical protein
VFLLSKIMSEKSFEEQQLDRYSMLRKLYDASGGSARTYINYFELAEQSGFTKTEAKAIHAYLRAERLFGFEKVGGYIALAHRAIVEIEKTIASPKSATEHFSPTIIQHFNSPNSGGVPIWEPENNSPVIATSANAPFHEAALKLIEMLNSSTILELDREEAVLALQRVQQLVEKKKDSPVTKLAREKIYLIKNIMEMSKGIAELGAPHLEIISEHFAK